MNDEVEIRQILPDPRPKGWRKAMGLVGRTADDIFIPAAAAGLSNQQAFFMCGFDAAPVVHVGRTVLVSMRWARKERPAYVETYDTIARRVPDIFSTGVADKKDGS